jgi:type VI secretion system protein ImpM
MEVGLYGKLPSHGDFLRRRAADDFVAAWDAWLQQCIAQSRAALGEAWLETYLTSPAWRFALSANVCGSSPVAGVLVPSVDRVGRYFPVTLVWPTPPDFSTVEVAVHFQAGFEAAERLLLDTLAAEQIEFSDFDRHVMELAASLEHPAGNLRRLTSATLQALRVPLLHPQCLPLRNTGDIAAPALQILGQLLDSSAGCCWWTEGSAVIEPSWLITQALPDGHQYCAMLDGNWPAAGWQVGEAETPLELDPNVAELPQNDGLNVVSGAHSDRGAVRASNQDAYLDRPDLRLWAVADGMGGMSDGDLASRMICDALANMPTAASLDEQLERIASQLGDVNSYLRRIATREVNPVQSGSTVVAVVIRGTQFAALWAGDSRVYRLRDATLTQLTTDHSWNEQEPGEQDEQAITRAVGVEDGFTPETVRGEVRAGDRFLLCTDGLYRNLDEASLGSVLGAREPAGASKELVTQAIAHGSTDNVTALIIDCGGIHPPALTAALDIVSL